MSGPDFPVIETTGGDRPPNTVAERGGVALAVVALAGGLLIAAGNLFGSDAGPAASASPVAHATPRPTPRETPIPGPREIVLVAGVLPSVAPMEPEAWQYNGWIRALVDQPIWTSADSNRADTHEVLAAGEIRYVDEVPDEPGWLHLSGAGGSRGFILVADGETPLVERMMPPPYLMAGEVWNLAAGPDGFVATGSRPAMSDQSSQWFSAFSSDGASWRTTDLPTEVSSIAWGPAGWLAVAWVGDQMRTPTTWVFRSPDGVHWDPLGMAPELDYAGQLVGSETGYLMDASGFGYGDWSRWFSTDGLSWLETDDPLPDGGNDGGSPHTAAVGSGFYAWVEGSDPAEIRSQAFSPDGREWHEVAQGPTGVNLRITTVGDRIIAAFTDPEDGSLHFVTGEIDGTRLTWGEEEAASAAVDVSIPGLGVAALLSDGQRAVAILWERSTDALVVFSSQDGHLWTPTALPPNAFGGIPRLAAGSSAGMVVVGARYTPRGSNSIFWRAVSLHEWEAEPSPLLPVVPVAGGGDCPSRPADAVGFVVLDRAAAAACFGDEPIRFRAWSAQCRNCELPPSGQYQPAWLADSAADILYLEPIEVEDGFSQQVYISPNLVVDPSWIGTWIAVTGHFDDPASASCHWTPSYAEEAWHTGQFWIVEGCRQQFVVTAVEVVEGP